MVRNRVGLVGEYPSRCLADDTTNDIKLNNTSAKQCFSFPIPKQSKSMLIVGLQDLQLEGFKCMQVISENGN